MALVCKPRYRDWDKGNRSSASVSRVSSEISWFRASSCARRASLSLVKVLIMAGLILGAPSIVKMKLQSERKKVRTMSIGVNILKCFYSFLCSCLRMEM